MIQPLRHLGRLLTLGLLAAGLAACDDDSIAPAVPDVDVDAAALEFGALDVDFGPGLARSVTVTNRGTSEASLGTPTLSGTAATQFTLEGPMAATTLGAGASLELTVSFDPSSVGTRTARLEIPVEGRDALSVELTGEGADFVFRQVDRVGIPTLNTVFNHPPQFSKIDYNRASPSQDVASYTALFETVLGAVANPDPAGTAALLLPDALPVSLAGATHFGTLTGRDLADDAVDVALSVTVGIASLKSDNVDANDRAFLAEFPWLAPPHG